MIHQCVCVCVCVCVSCDVHAFIYCIVHMEKTSLHCLLSTPSQVRIDVLPWTDDPPVCTWSPWFRRCGSGARRLQLYVAVPCRSRPAVGFRR